MFSAGMLLQLNYVCVTATQSSLLHFRGSVMPQMSQLFLFLHQCFCVIWWCLDCVTLHIIPLLVSQNRWLTNIWQYPLTYLHDIWDPVWLSFVTFPTPNALSINNSNLNIRYRWDCTALPRECCTPPPQHSPYRVICVFQLVSAHLPYVPFFLYATAGCLFAPVYLEI